MNAPAPAELVAARAALKLMLVCWSLDMSPAEFRAKSNQELVDFASDFDLSFDDLVAGLTWIQGKCEGLLAQSISELHFMNQRGRA